MRVIHRQNQQPVAVCLRQKQTATYTFNPTKPQERERRFTASKFNLIWSTALACTGVIPLHTNLSAWANFGDNFHKKFPQMCEQDSYHVIWNISELGSPCCSYCSYLGNSSLSNYVTSFNRERMENKPMWWSFVFEIFSIWLASVKKQSCFYQSAFSYRTGTNILLNLITCLTRIRRRKMLMTSQRALLLKKHSRFEVHLIIVIGSLVGLFANNNALIMLFM